MISTPSFFRTPTHELFFHTRIFHFLGLYIGNATSPLFHTRTTASPEACHVRQPHQKPCSSKLWLCPHTPRILVTTWSSRRRSQMRSRFVSLVFALVQSASSACAFHRSRLQIRRERSQQQHSWSCTGFGDLSVLHAARPRLVPQSKAWSRATKRICLGTEGGSIRKCSRPKPASTRFARARRRLWGACRIRLHTHFHLVRPFAGCVHTSMPATAWHVGGYITVRVMSSSTLSVNLQLDPHPCLLRKFTLKPHPRLIDNVTLCRPELEHQWQLLIQVCPRAETLSRIASRGVSCLAGGRCVGGREGRREGRGRWIPRCLFAAVILSRVVLARLFTKI